MSQALSADAYDSHWRSWPDFIRYNPGARHRRRLLLKMLDGLDFKDGLDVGCGNAELLGLLTAMYPTVKFTGADLSPEVVATNRKNVPAANFETLNIQSAALPRQYDLVLCSEVIEHLDDQGKAMSHLASMVKPGGHLIVTCPTGKIYQTERHFGHTHHPTVPELLGYANSAGLKSLMIWNWGWPFYKTLKWATNVNAEWSMRNFASGAYSAMAKGLSTCLYYANFANVTSRNGCQLFLLFRKA